MTNTDNSEFLPARRVQKRYDVSDMTIWRWLHDSRLGFPHPIYIGKRRYWQLVALEAWERKRAAASQGEAA